ncbi:MAG: aminotransferase class V-fold PLP-dependent enzyme, partial [Treponema sp.]|nr:aminotransferase class V-fold PLP-dependent enzyme [Treponema sp.]
MPGRRIYLDYNATTPLREAVKAAIIKDLEVFGNASSMHADGREARGRVEAARRAVGALLGTGP